MQYFEVLLLTQQAQDNMHLEFATAFWAGCATMRTAPTFKALHDPIAAAAARTSVARMVARSQREAQQTLPTAF
eukprot:918-Heterococcus_DN1.PRE.1